MEKLVYSRSKCMIQFNLLHHLKRGLIKLTEANGDFLSMRGQSISDKVCFSIDESQLESCITAQTVLNSVYQMSAVPLRGSITQYQLQNLGVITFNDNKSMPQVNQVMETIEYRPELSFKNRTTSEIGDKALDPKANFVPDNTSSISSARPIVEITISIQFDILAFASSHMSFCTPSSLILLQGCRLAVA